MKDRIQQIMQSEGLSNVDFAKKIEISTSSLSHIFNGRNNPSLDVVMHIHKAYPQVSLNWLLYGEGQMVSDGMKELIESEGANLFPELLKTPENADNCTGDSEFRKEMASETSILPPKEIVRQEIKYVERPSSKITEIRIFFDNGTYEVFKPEKNNK